MLVRLICRRERVLKSSLFITEECHYIIYHTDKCNSQFGHDIPKRNSPRWAVLADIAFPAMGGFLPNGRTQEHGK